MKTTVVKVYTPAIAGNNYYINKLGKEQSIDVMRYGQLWIKIMWYVKQRQHMFITC